MPTTFCHKCEVAPATATIHHCTGCQRTRPAVCTDCHGYSPHCKATRDKLLKGLRREERDGATFNPDHEEDAA